MLLVTNVRSLNEENELSKTKGKRQPLREAKNAANKLMVENALLEPDVNSDSDIGDESNFAKKGDKTYNENAPIKLGAHKYGCPFCSKLMPHSGHMKQHILTHTGENPFNCNECGAAFRHKHTLKRHNMIHTGERPSFICNDCGAAFNQKTTLKDHIMTHTGERPFSCDFCDKSFIQKNKLQRHVKDNHSKT